MLSILELIIKFQVEIIETVNSIFYWKKNENILTRIIKFDYKKKKNDVQNTRHKVVSF